MRGVERAPRAGARVLMGLVKAYRLVPKSPTPRCRFHPTCSAYALEALERYGAMRGSALAARRVARCHPFHPGGIDPVPDRERETSGPAPSASRPEGAAA